MEEQCLVAENLPNKLKALLLDQPFYLLFHFIADK